MSGKQAVIAVLAVMMCILGGSASAQDEKNEITGVLGRIFISDQGIHGPNAPAVNPFVRSGKGLTFEVNYSRLLFGTQIYSISGEVPAVFNLDEDLNSGAAVVPVDYKQIFVTPSARFNLFPDTAVSPWVSIGGGFARFSENKNHPARCDRGVDWRDPWRDAGSAARPPAIAVLRSDHVRSASR